MIVKIGVSFSAKEAREICLELNSLEEPFDDGFGGWTVKFPTLFKLRQRLEYPTATPDKIPAVVDNVQAP